MLSLATQAPGQNMTITGLSPARNARSAPTTTNVGVTFSQPISSNVANLTGLRVFSAQRGGLQQNGQGGITSVSGSTISFDPGTNFKPGETVRITSTTAIQSTAGNRLSRGQVFQFTTGVGGSGRGNFNVPLPAATPDPTVGNDPRSVAVGDIDGDGDLDMVTAHFNSSNNSVSVRLNNGSGYFTPHPTNPAAAVGNGSATVLLGDLDGDGDLDLVTLNLFDNTVSVRLNNGSGSFTSPATNPDPAIGSAGSNASSVALGDIDGDGDLDLVTASLKFDPNSFNGSTVSVRLNNGAGNFTPPATNAEISLSSYPLGVALGDMNGDGYLDLVVTNMVSTGSRVSVRLNNGSGSFTAPATNPDSEVGMLPQNLVLGDIDGDSDLDVIVANYNSATVSVRLNNGSGGLTPPTNNPDFTTGTSPGVMALGDVDADGDLDLVVANGYDTVSMRLNNGLGNFTPPVSNAELALGSNPLSVAFGDVDGDNDLDLLAVDNNYSNSTVRVRLNRSLLAPTITGLATSPNIICPVSPITFTASLGNITDSYSYTLSGGSGTPLSGSGTAAAFSQSRMATGTGIQSFTLVVESNGLRTTATTDLTPVAPPTATLVSSGPLSCTSTSMTLTAGGGSTGGPFTYAFAGPGLSYTGTGNQHTVSQAGNYSVLVTNANGCTALATTTVENRVATITVGKPATTNGTSGQAFSQSFVASGGSSPYSYSLASGSPSTGLNLSTTGVLSGTPTQNGSFTLTVWATDAYGCSALSQPYILQISDPNSPIRYVKAGGSGTGLGDSWANASSDLQSQIDLIGAQQVWVAQGTYKPGPTGSTNRALSFSMKNGVTIYGGFAPTGNPASLSERNPASFTTVLSGYIGTSNNSADNSYHVISNPAGLNNSAILDGFVINGGNANTFNSPDNNGGGMLNNGSGSGNTCSPLIRNCIFQNNSAINNGGAIYNAGYTSGASSPSLINCVFQDNRAFADGGAIYNAGYSSGTSNPRLVNCVFQRNNATNNGGAICNAGYSSGNSSLTLVNCSFVANSATRSGGALFNDGRDQGTSIQTLINCVVWNNGGASTFNNQEASISVNYSLFEPSVTGYNAGTGNLTTSILPFVSGSDARLNGCSLALNAGDNAANTTTTDVTGNARVFGSRIDMGAYEFQATPSSITLTIPSAGTVTAGTTFSQSFVASGGSSPYSYSLVSGSLPAGLSLASTGILSGTPTQSGSFTLTVRTTDATGCSVLSAAYVLTVVPASPIRYVRAGASGSGGSWTDASGDLQSQINVAGAQQVWVAQGTYKPTSTTGPASRTISFAMKSGVAIYGGFAPTGSPTSLSERKPSSFTTVLSGDIGTAGNSTDNSYHVIHNVIALTSTAVLDGFIIRDGNANNFGVSFGLYGGGILNVAVNPDGSIPTQANSPTLRNCIFLNNSAGYGGGIYNYKSNSTLTNCSFQNNSGTTGGGICNESSNVTLTNCSFQNNSATTGSGVMNTNGTTSVINSVLFGNGGPTTLKRDVGSITLRYSLVEPSLTDFTDEGNNLTTFDSPFVSNSSTQLKETSLAINTGLNSASGLSGIATDLAGNPRFFNSGIVDMGAYEYQADPPASQPIRYVKAGGAGTGSGNSWANASGDLQSQINVAGAQQVWVAQGIYKPGLSVGTNRALSFSMKNGVAIYGGFAPTGNPASLSERKPISFTTVLSGDIGTAGNSTDNSYHVISNPSGLNNSALLDGFVISGGNANGSSSPDDAGGAILNKGNGSGGTCSPLIRNCIFQNNNAANLGGAIYNAGYTSGASSPTLINCVFVNNSSANLGGAIYNDGSVGGTSSPILTNCSFLSNSATNSGGAMGSVGYQGNSRPVLTNCIVWGNGGASTFTNGPGAIISTSYSLFESSVTGYNAGTGNLTATVSPFVSGSDARLNGCSSALNAGDDAANTTTSDLSGNARVFGSRIDLGAYEFQTTGGLFLSIPDLNTATVGVSFSQNFVASAGAAPFSYSLASGNLPPGLSLNSTGVLSGTPTQAGSFTLTARATDATSCSGASGPYVLTVNTIVGLVASPGAVCVGSLTTFTATVGTSNGSYSYTLSNGLTTPLTGTASNSVFSLSLTATGSGIQTYTLTVTANGQRTSSQTVLLVNPLPVASLGHSGTLSCAQTSVTLTAGGGGAYTFVSGSGVVGTTGPTNTLVVNTPGTYSVLVTSASGCVSSTSTTVAYQNCAPTLANAIPPQSATVGQYFTFTIPANTFSDAETPDNLSLSVVGLPMGLSFLPPNSIAGTVWASSSTVYSVTVVASDPTGGSVSTLLSLSVVNPTGSCQSMYSVKAGSWNDAGVWSCGRVPLLIDVVTLNHAVSLPASYQGQAQRIIYSNNGRLLFGTSSRLRLGGN
ncbi:fibronectin type III domain-containing protein [Spirosoma daeguense]